MSTDSVPVKESAEERDFTLYQLRKLQRKEKKKKSSQSALVKKMRPKWEAERLQKKAKRQAVRELKKRKEAERQKKYEEELDERDNSTELSEEEGEPTAEGDTRTCVAVKRGVYIYKSGIDIYFVI